MKLGSFIEILFGLSYHGFIVKQSLHLNVMCRTAFESGTAGAYSRYNLKRSLRYRFARSDDSNIYTGRTSEIKNECIESQGFHGSENRHAFRNKWN